MTVFENLKTRAKSLKKEVTAIYYAYKNPQVGWPAKLLILIALGYALSPIDFIPDFIPVLGYLDDLLIVPALIAISIRWIPKQVMEEARKKAENEPLTLKRNWIFGILFILIWITFIILSGLSFL